MTHLPYVVPSYLLGAATPLWLGWGAWRRLRRVQRRLRALDPRGREFGGS